MLKTVQSPYVGNGSIDLHEIWHGHAFWLSESYFVSDIAIFVLKRDVKLQLTN